MLAGMQQKAGLKLLCLKAPAPQFDPAKGVEGLPQRILVMPWGDNATADGQVIVNDTTLKTLGAYNASKGWDRPALDFEHSSVPGSPTYKGEPVKVAGYGTIQVVQGEGIYMLMSSWTEEGKQFAAGGHYGDLSPVVQVNDNNEVIGCHSAALCRHGATPGLLFLSATSTMDPKPPQTADELVAALKTVLGLGADATPADILAGLTDKMKAAKPAETAEDDKDMKQLSATVTELQGTVKLLSQSLAQGEREAILQQAARDGKVVPKTAAEALTVENLKKLCAELPVTVPLERRTPDVTTLMLSSGAGTDDSISRQTGVTKELRDKYAGK